MLRQHFNLIPARWLYSLAYIKANEKSFIKEKNKTQTQKIIYRIVLLIQLIFVFVEYKHRVTCSDFKKIKSWITQKHL